MYIRFQLILAMLCMSIMAISQEELSTIQKITDKKYNYNEMIYNYKHMHDIFETDSLANALYNKSLSSFSKAKTLGYSSIIGFAVGIIPALVDNATGGIGIGGAVTLLVWFIVAPALGTTGIIKYARAKKKLNSAVDAFNANVRAGYSSRNDDRARLNLSFRNGIGISLQF